ncbi:MAG: hypothetical protein K2X47_18430 [Bdellovibrionales bacterium]|nr:hypothetical protein [Bdellovibrionales bacterium]
MNFHEMSFIEIRSKYPHAENLGEVLGSIQRDLESSQEVVCGFSVNGMEFDESDEDRLKSCRVDEIKSISVKSSSVKALVGESLRSGIAYVRQISQSAEVLSTQFRNGDRKRAFEDLNALSESLSTVFDLMRYIQRLGHIRSDAPAEIETQFIKMMTSLVPAVEKRDFIFIADLLEYEVSSILSQIGEIFSHAGQVSNSGETP